MRPQKPLRIGYILVATRRYVESLGNVQNHVRKNTAELVASARKAVSDAITTYVTFSAASPIGLQANSLSGDRVAVFLDWDDVRKRLADRNGSMVNLSLRTVVSAGRKNGT